MDNSNLNGMLQTNAPSQEEEQDHHLPIANIARIMKKVLPSNAQVSKVSIFNYS